MGIGPKELTTFSTSLYNAVVKICGQYFSESDCLAWQSAAQAHCQDVVSAMLADQVNHKIKIKKKTRNYESVFQCYFHS